MVKPEPRPLDPARLVEVALAVIQAEIARRASVP